MEINTLKGENIFLRALEPSDLDFLYMVENEESLWEVSNTTAPFSYFVLKEYLENSYRDIYEVKQLRLVICKTENPTPIGFIDLYDFDPKHRRIGVGIVIFKDRDKQKGFASESLRLVCNYAFQHLNVHQIYAGITEDNTGSIKLFENAGFERNGLRRDWIFADGDFKAEYIYQLFRMPE